MKQKKLHCCSNKLTTQYGTLINVNLKLEDLQKIEKNGWVQITIAERKTPSEKESLHTMFENNYQPKPQTEKEKSSQFITSDDADVPF